MQNFGNGLPFLLWHYAELCIFVAGNRAGGRAAGSLGGTWDLSETGDRWWSVQNYMCREVARPDLVDSYEAPRMPSPCQGEAGQTRGRAHFVQAPAIWRSSSLFRSTVTPRPGSMGIRPKPWVCSNGRARMSSRTEK